jgi:hypothetical protein
MRRLIVAVAIFAVSAIPVDAQSPRDPIDIWASATLGGARGADNELGAQLSLSAAKGHWLGTIRFAGATKIDFSDEPSHDDIDDWSLLVGARTHPGAAITSLALGPATVTSDPGSGLKVTKPGIAFVAEESMNARYLGIALTAFGAASSAHAYAGLGLTVQLGKIR